MIKVETIGMLDRAVINPVITSESAVANYSFITVDGDLYLVANTVTGDNAYVDDTTFAAGTYLNGHLVKAWDGQKLVVDERHIAYSAGKTYANLAKNNIMTVSDGKLAVVDNAPASGVYFKITDVGCTLLEKAIKVKVMVADNTGEAPVTTLAGLTDVDTTGATEGQVLKLNSSGKWAPAADATE